MSKYILVFVFLLCAKCSDAQDLNARYEEQVSSMENILTTLYGVISGEAGEPRDWDLFHHLFKEGAQLIPSGPTKNGPTDLRYLKPQDYVDGSGQWLVENGFHEIEINRVVDKFGAICHVFSSYEAFNSKNDEKPFMRGINSIQLLDDGTRWWIVNIFWTQESVDNPIPEKYLKG